ncbi:hypothetical protein LCGC14_2818510 [marine sediment metagenome]|uniref:Uncharacterized protein n=1 Tax=marine sediment metagenome TaxID=412755 RepID=A0A0F8Z4L7_9ZZZZ
MAFGGPDWLANRWPVRSTLGTNQTRYVITAAAAIASGGSAVLDVTVAAGTRQVFALIEATSPVSVIQEVDISINTVVLWRRFYDVAGVISFPPEAALMLSAGSVLRVTIHNFDADTQTIRLNIAGTIEDA